MHEAAKVALEKAGFTIEKLQNHIKELEVENAELKEPKTCRTCAYSGAYTMGWMPCMNESVGDLFKYGINDNFGCVFYKYMHEPKAP